jgi:predicted phosphoribosyltransferase
MQIKGHAAPCETTTRARRDRAERTKTKMKITATIMDDGIETGETLTDRTLTGIYRQMCAMLSVAGPRGLHARTAHGAEIICSLYEGHSSIISANGRVIFKS